MRLYEIDSDDIDYEYYMSEGCSQYALAVHDYTGYPIVLFTGNDGDEFDLGFDIFHVAVKHPDKDCFIDVKGCRDKNEIFNDFGNKNLVIEYITRDELLSYMGDNDKNPLCPFDKEDYDRALKHYKNQL